MNFLRFLDCFGLYIDKTCVLDVFSESPLNTDTMACSLGVCINRVPLYIVFLLSSGSIMWRLPAEVPWKRHLI